MDLSCQLWLGSLNSPLRHFSVAPIKDNYVFTHVTSGTVLKVSCVEAHASWANSTDPEPIHVFERLLPPLCYECGEPLTGSAVGVCGSCVTAKVAQLRALLQD